MCEYCEKNEKPIKNDEIRLSVDTLLCPLLSIHYRIKDKDDYILCYATTALINYCPMCGRKL